MLTVLTICYKRLYMYLCFECSYLSKALPSCGCVCQGDKLSLHLINPFFNPIGQSNRHKLSCNPDLKRDITGISHFDLTVNQAIFYLLSGMAILSHSMKTHNIMENPFSK